MCIVQYKDTKRSKNTQADPAGTVSARINMDNSSDVSIMNRESMIFGTI
jgi:hypothetical protein